MFRLCEEIKEVRLVLVAWSSNVFGKSNQILQAKLSLLEDLKKGKQEWSVGGPIAYCGRRGGYIVTQ